jgi:caa(3)-type oxidase subunit IV
LTEEGEGRRILLAGGALLALAAGSWGLAHVRLGSLAAPVALAIATLKALVVALVFMRLAHGMRAARFALGIALGFIALLSVGVAADVLTR